MYPLIWLLLTGCSDYGYTPAEAEPEAPLDTAVEAPVEEPISVLVVSPSFVDFGEVELGSEHSAVVSLENAGDLALSVASLALEGEEGPFTIGPPSSWTLEPGARTEVVVTYAPSEAGLHEDALDVLSDAIVDGTAQVALSGEALTPPEPHDIVVQLTGDDSWAGTLDGEPIGGPNQDAWSSTDVLELGDLEPGEHVLAVHVWDVGRSVAGFLAAVHDGDEVLALSGSGAFAATGTQPAAGWELPGFDDSAWGSDITCTAVSAVAWANRPVDLTATGAAWSWTSDNCRSLGEAWFRLSFTLE